ncbi:DUF3025 family protein [Tepidicella xavieri]|uniref:DUF3025 family protein n=2 Tax=Tepidicella xavieri TaxID=360241 RepID=A0A4V3D6T1_9BURK|nr:DUF3025 family protein [Tepidicella xavieri]
MAAAGLTVWQAPAIDWAAAWMTPWRAWGQALWRQVQAAQSRASAPTAVVATVLQAAGWAPVRFVPQAELPAGVAYESHIFATGSVPTRDNLHDFFNALVWMRFPQTKRALNRLQAQAIEAAGGVGATRGPLRDALTLFDENVLLLQAPEPLWQALRARAWKPLFGALRPLWAQAQVVTFGHALTEKLVQPYKSITAHVLCLPLPRDLPPDPGTGPHPWDAWLAPRLRADWLAAKPYTPLPVMGIPGWCPANEDAAYYDDTEVFRPPRPARPAGA